MIKAGGYKPSVLIYKEKRRIMLAKKAKNKIKFALYYKKKDFG